MNAWQTVPAFALGLGFAWKGEPWLRRHPLAGCVFFAFLAAFLAGAAVANAAVNGAWGWAALQGALAALCVYGFWKYRGRRKAAKASPA